MGSSLEHGRARLVAILVLLFLIGIAGAIVGPRLLHEAGRTTEGGALGQVCLGIREGLEGTSPGAIRLWARGPGRSELDETTQAAPLPSDASPDSYAALLRQPAAKAGWDAASGVQVAGQCLALGRVSEVGGAPGATGLTLSLGLAAEASEALGVRVSLDGVDASAMLPALKVDLHVRGTWRAESDTPKSRIGLEMVSTAGDLFQKLHELTDRAGWTVEPDGELAFVVRGLPADEPLNSLLFTVTYANPGDEPPGKALWKLKILP